MVTEQKHKSKLLAKPNFISFKKMGWKKASKKLVNLLENWSSSTLRFTFKKTKKTLFFFLLTSCTVTDMSIVSCASRVPTTGIHSMTKSFKREIKSFLAITCLPCYNVYTSLCITKKKKKHITYYTLKVALTLTSQNLVTWSHVWTGNQVSQGYGHERKIINWHGAQGSCNQ